MKICSLRELGHVHCTLYTAHCTLYTAHCTLYTVHCTLHTVHCTLHTVHCTLHTAHCTLYTVYCTLSLQTVHCTCYTVHCTNCETDTARLPTVPWSHCETVVRKSLCWDCKLSLFRSSVPVTLSDGQLFESLVSCSSGLLSRVCYRGGFIWRTSRSFTCWEARLRRLVQNSTSFAGDLVNDKSYKGL
jgi:hypothetical protein